MMAVASPMATESRSSSSSRRSLKRCRSFGHLAKGLGVVGAAAGCCTLLVATTQSTSGWAMPSNNTVWHSQISATHTPAARADPHHPNNFDNHGTTPGRLRRHTKNVSGNSPTTAAVGGGGDILSAAVAFRRLAVDARLQAAVGDWSSCTSDCTRTRKVMCTTLDYKIVPDHLCGEELPPSTETCETDACASRSTTMPEKKQTTKEEKKTPEGGDKKDSEHDEGEHEEGTLRTEATTAKGAGKVEKYASVSVSSEPPQAYGGAVGGGGAVEVADAVSTETETVAAEKSDEQKRAGSGGSRAGSRVHGMNRAGHDADGSPMGGQGQQSAKPKEGRDDGDEALWQEENSKKNRKNHRAFGPNNSSDKGNGRVSERGTDDVRGAEDVGLSTKDQSKPRENNANFAARPKSRPQGIERIGGGPGSIGERRRRSWTVIMIGTGAVGSFLVVVFFAVSQYRKEQHRLRGIMALNEFPVDNYINPFCAVELKEEDRSAFKL